MQKISAYILTYNEAEKIEAAVSSVLWADEVVVVEFIQHRPHRRHRDVARRARRGHAVQRFRRLAQPRDRGLHATTGSSASTPTSVAPPRCATKFLRLLAGAPPHEIYMVPRRSYMMGRWIKGSGWYPNFRQPQLFRKGAMRYTLEPVHEGFEVIGAASRLGTLRNAIWQFPFRNLEEVISKMNRYSTLGAPKLAGKRVSMATRVRPWRLVVHQALHLQARLHRRLGRLRHRVRQFRRDVLSLRQALRRDAGLEAARKRPAPARSSRRDGLAQSARKIAQHPKWQGQVIFAYDLPTIGPPAFGRGLARYVPTVVFVAPDDAITGRKKVPVLRQVADMILQQDQARLPAQRYRSRAALRFRDLRRRSKGNRIATGVSASFRMLSSVRTGTLMTSFRHGARRHVMSIERGQRSRHMEWQRFRPAFSGEEHATANTLALRLARNWTARSGCGSTRTPVQPACSRNHVCERSRGSLAPTSTK